MDLRLRWTMVLPRHLLEVDETDLSIDDDGNAFAGAFEGVFGADGMGSIGYALTITQGSDSGLVDVATGNAVFLFLEGGVVVGREGVDALAAETGEEVFTVSVDAGTGAVSLDQVRALEHGVTTDPNDAVSPVTGSIQLTATITDGDGDTDDAMLDLSDGIVFRDDGPVVALTGVDPEPELEVDETNLGMNDMADFSGLFSVDFGADGDGGVVYTLGVVAGPSGLVDTATGNAVFLFLESGVVVGREGVDAAAAATGAEVFTVSVDGAGMVTLDQIRAVVHSDADDPNDAAGLSADNLITLTATATDGDGDTDPETANIGQNLTFLDDGPTVTVTAADNNLVEAITDDDGDPSVDSFEAATLFTVLTDFGADGMGMPNVESYSLSLVGNEGDPSGLTSGGNAINLFISDDGLTGDWFDCW